MKNSISKVSISKVLFFVSFLLISCNKKANYSSNEPTGLCSFEEKVAFIDRKVIESKMGALKNVEEAFSKEEMKLRKDLIEQKNKLETRYKEIEKMKNDGLLGKRELEEKVRGVEKDFIKLQQSEREAGEMMNFVKMQIAFEVNQKIHESAKYVVDERADEKCPLVMVFDTNSLFYIDSRKVDDLTYSVLANVDKNFKSLDIAKYFDDAKKALTKMKKNLK